MAVPAKPPLTFIAGDDETFILTICSDADGTVPVDITGRTYVMSIAPDGGSVVASDAGTVNGAAGEVTFLFTATVTEALALAPHRYDVVETASGAESTLIIGLLNVVPGVTA